MENIKNIYKNKLITKPIIISSVLFMVAFIIGVYIYDVLLPFVTEEVSISKIGVMKILKNNMTVCYLNIILSILTFGVYGIVSNMYNGLLLGIVVGIAKAKYGLSTVLLRILPHGIIEIPTIIISTAFGFMAISLVYNLIKKKDVDLKKTFKEYITVIVIMTILIVVAAVIEGKISMNLQ